MIHWFPTYDECYKGYGLTKCQNETCTASNDTPELQGKMDYPNIGLGWSVDNGRSYSLEEIKQRIDEVIAERGRRIGWVREFSQTQKNPEWTERYLMESCDPNNDEGHQDRSNHAEAELYGMWYDGTYYKMHWGMRCVTVSKTKFLYRKFLIEKGYIIDNK
ncbi:MAG: hypothetical protein J5732_02750 [Bacteroidaceae bacterium]|nr:hypothetical protein [Bacteroidaceae bacterium]